VSVTMSDLSEYPELLTPAQVARIFCVDPKTVTRWARAGKLTSIRTPGGHRRYRKDEVKRLYETAGDVQ
jgi:excisionase family DNA binding protein